MQIFINRLTRRLQRSVADSREPSSPPQFKRGDVVSVEIIYVESGVQVQLAASSSVIFALKEDGKYDSAALVYEDGFTLSGSGATAKYTATPSFNSSELNDEFLIDGNDANDVARLTLMGEITWSNGATTDFTSTDTFDVIVNNDVIRDEEVTPTPGAIPIGDTAPVNGTEANGTLTLSANPSATETVTIGSVVYTWRVAVSAANDVKIGTDAADSLFNLAAAVSAAGFPGTLYGTGTLLNPLATMDSGTGICYARETGTAGNSIVTTETMANGSWSSATLTGGTDGTASPPYIRVAGGFLYIQEAGVWKKTALSAL